MSTVDEFLQHYGVKGQKWGVRRRRRSSDSSSSSGGKPKLRAKDLSDDDLKKAIARMELERRYTQLSGGDSGNTTRAVANFLASVGTTAAKTALTAAATQQVNNALKNATRK